MGQKTNPNLFRLLIKKRNQKSNWYTNKSRYSTNIKEDHIIRVKIEETFKNIIAISRIDILKKENQVLKIILSLFLPTNEGRLIEYISAYGKTEILEKNYLVNINLLRSMSQLELIALYNKIVEIYIKKINSGIKLTFKQYLKVQIKINPILNEFSDAKLIAHHVVNLLEKRIPYRRAIKATINNIEQNFKCLGIKIQVSGRLNGTDIARTEWKREGQIPLHTLTANVEYAFESAYTLFGLLGIKVWLYY